VWSATLHGRMAVLALPPLCTALPQPLLLQASCCLAGHGTIVLHGTWQQSRCVLVWVYKWVWVYILHADRVQMRAAVRHPGCIAVR
jgi:hypothetical protein